MKTTLNIRDDLLAEAKVAAVRNHTTLTRLVEEGLALRLRTTRSVSTSALAELPVSKRSGGLRAGIDGRSNRSMMDAADE